MERTENENQLAFPFLADLVVLARGLNPFPYRTRPLNSSAPMVLSLKAWKSRSLPGLPRTDVSQDHDDRLRGCTPRLEKRPSARAAVLLGRQPAQSALPAVEADQGGARRPVASFRAIPVIGSKG